jgi:phenylalanyl-tRNA synthetase alpha subunit-like protein
MTTSGSAPSGDLTSRILHALSQKDSLLSTEAFPEVPFADIKAALDRLASRSMVAYDTIEREEAILEAEGQQIAEHGSHEARVFEALRQAVGGLTVQDLEKAIGDKTVTKVGQGKAFKEKWVKKGDDGKLIAVVSLGPPLQSTFASMQANPATRPTRSGISHKNSWRRSQRPRRTTPRSSAISRSASFSRRRRSSASRSTRDPNSRSRSRRRRRT